MKSSLHVRGKCKGKLPTNYTIEAVLIVNCHIQWKTKPNKNESVGTFFFSMINELHVHYKQQMHFSFTLPGYTLITITGTYNFIHNTWFLLKSRLIQCTSKVK